MDASESERERERGIGPHNFWVLFS
jgi:hypothetical protein